MTPAAAIASLDRQLAAHGQWATLRRYSGTGTSRTPTDVAVRIRADDYRPEELAGGIEQGATRVIMSPSQILAAGWPGPLDWPRIGDALVIDGREREVQSAPPVRLDGVVVRINLTVTG